METKGKILFWENGVESEVIIAFGTYQQGGRLSVSLYRRAEDGTFTDLYDVITVNFVESQLLPVGAQFIDENNHPGIGKWLEKNGIARPLDIWIRSGFCRYPAYQFISQDGNRAGLVLYKSFYSNGSVSLMSGVDKSNPDYGDLISIAVHFAKQGKDVSVLAPVHYKDPRYRDFFGPLIGTAYFRKCPDLLINGRYYEYESYTRPFKASKISHMIKRGAEQSSRIIIDNNKGASDRFIINMVLKRLNDKFFKNEIRELWIYEKGTVRRLFLNKKAEGSLDSPRGTNP